MAQAVIENARNECDIINISRIRQIDEKKMRAAGIVSFYIFFLFVFSISDCEDI